MKYQVVYESLSGNTALVAQAIADALPTEQTELINFQAQTPTKCANVYFIGFAVRHGICSLEMLNFLGTLDNKTIFLFATCGLYPDSTALERAIRPFLPDTCRYLGLHLCQGAISDTGVQALKRRFSANSDQLSPQHLESLFTDAACHPNENDLYSAKSFALSALSL